MTVPSEFVLLHYGKEVAMLANCILEIIFGGGGGGVTPYI